MHQDTWIVSSTPAQVIAGGLQHVGPANLQQLKAYLDTILDGLMTDQQIAQLWDAAGTEWRFTDPRETRRFLEQVRRAIGM